MTNKAHVQLPIYFDPDKLKADLAEIRPTEWINHYRGDHYEGNWSVVPLRSVGGHPSIIYSTPAGTVPDFYKDTPILERCANFQAAINWFQCQVNGARLMSLDADARILEHTDDMDTSEIPELRIHIPILTNEHVEFWVAGKLVPMREGEAWYADFNRPHSVNNLGDMPRIHLVLDCTLNDWLVGQLEKGEHIRMITSFLNEIGIETKAAILDEETFLPGIKIENGKIWYDTRKLTHPGDLLHEAGHIAVSTPEERAKLSGNVGAEDNNAMGSEIAAILWSYAAIKHIALPTHLVFHADGYKGQSDWFLSNFETEQNYIGLPYLAWMGLASGNEKNAPHTPIFPRMIQWLRQ